MKQLTLFVLLLASLTSGCSSASDRAAGRPDTDGTGTSERADTERTAAIYASIVRQLVTKDHTFGRADPGFKKVFVLDGAVAGAENPFLTRNDRHPDHLFRPTVKQRMADRLVDLPPLVFVSRRSAAVVGAKPGVSPGHVANGGVLLTLGPIEGEGSKVQVGANLWINGLAGHWLRYVAELRGGGWRVIGTTGPVAIS